MRKALVVLGSSMWMLLAACSSSSDGGTSATRNDGGTSTTNEGGSPTDGSTTTTDGGPQAGAPSAPTKLLMVLQGQDSPSSTTSAPTPTNPNRIDIAWTAGAAGDHPIDHYEIYRSTDGTTFTPYATSTTTTYSDTNATNAVSGTAGAAAPYYTATTYFYEVSAVDTANVEGPRSTTQSFVVYSNGTFNWGGDFDYGGLQSDYQDTTGGSNGDAKDIKVTVDGAYGGWLPYSGNLVTQWNMWAGAFGYLELDLKPTISGQKWGMSFVRVGDVPIYDDTGTSPGIDLADYGPAPVANTWGHYKIPLQDVLTDYGPAGTGPAVLENAIYKFGLQDKTGNASGTWYIDNVVFTPR